MSSTGRGLRVGGPEDFYVTPSWCVRRLLEEYEPAAGLWLEPGAGNGSIIRAANAVRSRLRWVASEIREGEHVGLRAIRNVVEVYGDFLSGPVPALCSDVRFVIGNPPFAYAQDFIDRIREVAPHAEVALLLRLNYVGSAERSEFMRSRAPDVHSLPNRPSFFLRLTDSIEYAWLVWPPPALALRRIGTFRVLRPTSLEERQRDMPETGRCAGCGGRGALGPGGIFAARNTPGATPCLECFGFGKVVIGPSEVERGWRAAA